MAIPLGTEVKAIVFDFDGTLVDSTKLKYEARFELFADEPEDVRAIADTVIPTVRGKLRGEIARAILSQTHPHLPAEAFEEKVLDFCRRYDALVEDRIVSQGLFPGAREMLDAAASRCRLYVNSGTPDYALQRLLERLEVAPLLKGIYGIHPSRTEGASFVKKENLSKILVDAGVPPNEVVVVGDGIEDFETAQAHGCHFVGVRSERAALTDEHGTILESVARLADHLFPYA